MGNYFEQHTEEILLFGFGVRNREVFRNYSSESKIILDFVYSPNETKLIKYAKEKNLRVIQGIDILLHHASKTFELWVNKDLPLMEIKEILTKII